MQRRALLVATYRYEDAGLSQLTAPGYDAQKLAEVLRDPDIAGFDVDILLNEPNHVVRRLIGEFYRKQRRDDLALLYFTGHGLKDDHGDLYLAMTDTQRDNLLYTAVSARDIDRSMESCLSQQKVLVLDCCYSGAFPAGRMPKADREVQTLDCFKGKGRVVLTASDATQYSFEGDSVSGRGTPSVFTRFLVEGLTTGEADLNGDGDIDLEELYSYLHERVSGEIPQQRPKIKKDVEGHIIIAQNIHWKLPADLAHAMESPVETYRLPGFDELLRLHRNSNDFVRSVIVDHVHRLVDNDSKAVSACAIEFIESLKSENSVKGFGSREPVKFGKVKMRRLSLPTVSSLAAGEVTADDDRPRDADAATQIQGSREARSSSDVLLATESRPVVEDKIPWAARLIYRRFMRINWSVVSSVISFAVLVVVALLLFILTPTTPGELKPAEPVSTAPPTNEPTVLPANEPTVLPANEPIARSPAVRPALDPSEPTATPTTVPPAPAPADPSETSTTVPPPEPPAPADPSETSTTVPPPEPPAPADPPETSTTVPPPEPEVH